MVHTTSWNKILYIESGFNFTIIPLNQIDYYHFIIHIVLIYCDEIITIYGRIVQNSEVD